jgi:hypothetical protein
MLDPVRGRKYGLQRHVARLSRSMNLRDLSALLAGLPPRGSAGWLDALRRAVRERPRCGVGRYLLGCELLDQGQTATAVRQMMVAHHVEPALESAALLVFAGLDCVSRSGTLLLPALLDTWEEFRRPEFDRARFERALLDAFDEPLTGVAGISPLALRLWRLPIRTLRAQIRAAVLSQDAAHYPMLLAPA